MRKCQTRPKHHLLANVDLELQMFYKTIIVSPASRSTISTDPDFLDTFWKFVQNSITYILLNIIVTIIFIKLGLNLSLSNKKGNLAKGIQIFLAIVSQSLGLLNSLSILWVEKIILVVSKNAGRGFIRK